jgi:curved DNA-binding protein CbpA
MSRINSAYEVLSDPARRAHYNETGQDLPTKL